MINNQQGQTLAEAVVAIAVIVMAFIGFLTVSTNNFLVVAESEDRMVASQLSRELVEAARSIRDLNWLHGCPDPTDPGLCLQWDTGLASPTTDYNAIISFIPAISRHGGSFAATDMDSCEADDSCRLYLHDNGVYDSVAEADKDTKFTRLISIKPVCSNTSDCGGDGICENGESCISEKIGLKIISHVRWYEKDRQQNIELENFLYKWR